MPTDSVVKVNCGTSIPDWFTTEYLEDRMRKYYKDATLKINNMMVSSVIGKGENFGGELARIKVIYKGSCDRDEKLASYILKTSFEGNEFAKETMKPYDIFNREMSIYESVIPKMKILMNEIDGNDNDRIFANTIAVDYERSAILFEDLSAENFTMPDRTKGLDMKHARLVLRKLAKLHALSAVLNERQQGSLEGYDRGMFNRHTNNYSPCFLGLLEACGHLVSQWPEYREYGRKLLNLRPVYMEYGKRVFDAIDGQFNVLAHGDLWANNVMFKYEKNTNEPIDVIIIDFQYSAWGSPAIDLHYFLNTSLREEMHLNKQDELLQFYYYILVDTLKELNYQGRVPSLHEFHVQMEEKLFYAFNSSCIVQPVQLIEETDDADFNALMQEDERAKNFKKTVYKNANVQRKLKLLLPFYDRKGLLDASQ